MELKSEDRGGLNVGLNLRVECGGLLANSFGETNPLLYRDFSLTLATIYTAKSV